MKLHYYRYEALTYRWVGLLRHLLAWHQKVEHWPPEHKQLPTIQRFFISQHFNGQWKSRGQTWLSWWLSWSPLIFALDWSHNPSILSAEAKTFHILLDTIHQVYLGHPLSLVLPAVIVNCSTNQHHLCSLYVQLISIIEMSWTYKLQRWCWFVEQQTQSTLLNHQVDWFKSQ